MARLPWIVSDGRERRYRYPGRKRLSDRAALQGILYVLCSGIGWEHLPRELGFGSGWTCWRPMDEWQRAGVWERLHTVLLSRLRTADQLDWRRAVIDGSHIQAKRGAPKRVPAPSTEAGLAASTT